MTDKQNDAPEQAAMRVVEQMGLGLELRSCTCGQLPCLRLQPLVTAIAEAEARVWEQAISAVKHKPLSHDDSCNRDSRFCKCQSFLIAAEIISGLEAAKAGKK